MIEHTQALCTNLVGETVSLKEEKYIIRAISLAQYHSTEDLSCIIQKERTGKLSIAWASDLRIRKD